MLSASIPKKFPLAFGANAGSAYIRSIPTTSQIGIQNGAASLNDGFPPLNFVATADGGVPPFGEDMNGILNQSTLWNQWQQAGGPVFYDSAFSASIGGYPKWTVLSNATTPGSFWVSSVENNLTDPDTGGANWINTSTTAVGGVLSGNLPNPGMAAGAAATNVGSLGGSLSGTLPDPTIAASGVSAGSYVGASITVGTDGRLTAAASATYPTYTTLTSGSAATYTTPAGAKRLKIRMAGGGAAGGTFSANGGNGTASSFGSWTANPGDGGQKYSNSSAPSGGAGGSGGSNGTGTQIVRFQGGYGQNGGGGTTSQQFFSPGGANPFGGNGATVSPNTGAGGTGTSTIASGGQMPGGGGAGEYVEFVINNPTGTYTYTVGAGGTVSAGQNGAAGIILVEENYQ